MPGAGLRAAAPDVVRPGGNGRQIVVAQEWPQPRTRGFVDVVPGDVGDDSVAPASPRKGSWLGQ